MDNPAVGTVTVNPDGTAGVFTAVAAGAANLVATDGKITSAPFPVNVVADFTPASPGRSASLCVNASVAPLLLVSSLASGQANPPAQLTPEEGAALVQELYARSVIILEQQATIDKAIKLIERDKTGSGCA